MAKRSNFTQLFLTATSFAGGIAVGMLLAPKSGKENRKWVNEYTTEFADWVDGRGKEILIKSGQRISRVSKKIQQGIQKNLPDLYDATEEIRLNESDFIGV